jgi:hypothetical protein
MHHAWIMAALIGLPGADDVLKPSGPELKGWTRLPIPADAKVKAESPWTYDAETGVLTCRGEGHHEWLRLDRELGDARIHVEWRFVKKTGAKGYNSGVMVRNSADGVVWHQAQTPDGGGTYLFGETPKGDGRRSFKVPERAENATVKPAGEWNTYDITCKGPEIALVVNGKEVARLIDSGQPRGYFGLEAEGYTIEFRKVTIESLD